MKVLSETEAIEGVSSLFQRAQTEAAVVWRGVSNLCAIVPMNDFELIRRARAEGFLALPSELGGRTRARAEADGVTVDELLRTLDRKAS